jgi:hypothetical protein
MLLIKCEYLTGDAEVYANLYFDQVIEINLSEPHLNGPLRQI